MQVSQCRPAPLAQARRASGFAKPAPLQPRRACIVRFKGEKDAESPNRKAADEVRQKGREVEDVKWKAEQRLSDYGDKAKDAVSSAGQSAKEAMPSSGQLKDSLPAATDVIPSLSKPKLSPQATRVPWYIPAFTRRREAFIGRLAILGFPAACFSEWVFPNHPNIMQQVAGFLQTAGLPIGVPQVATLIGVLVAYNAIAGLAPGSPTWSKYNQEDVQRRPPGLPQNLENPSDVKQVLGVTGWGFSKANEVVQGRLAMLGIAAALIQQMRLGGYAGPGPLAQVAHYLGAQDLEAFYAGVPGVFIPWGIFALVLAYLAGRPGTVEGEEEIY